MHNSLKYIFRILNPTTQIAEVLWSFSINWWAYRQINWPKRVHKTFTYSSTFIFFQTKRILHMYILNIQITASCSRLLSYNMCISLISISIIGCLENQFGLYNYQYTFLIFTLPWFSHDMLTNYIIMLCFQFLPVVQIAASEGLKQKLSLLWHCNSLPHHHITDYVERRETS